VPHFRDWFDSSFPMRLRLPRGVLRAYYAPKVSAGTRRWTRGVAMEARSAALQASVPGEQLVGGLAAQAAASAHARTVGSRGGRLGSPAAEGPRAECHGGPCYNAGASAVWSHLRAKQERPAPPTTAAGDHEYQGDLPRPLQRGAHPAVPARRHLSWRHRCVRNRPPHPGPPLGCGVVEDLAYRPTGAKRALRS
jgi:hypothetical protein